MSLRWLQRVGVAGLVGAALLAAAAWTDRVWLPRQQGELAQSASKARRLRHELQGVQEAKEAASSASQVDVAQTPEQAWQLVWQGLPGAERRVELQSQVLSQARAQGLQINTVQYQGSRQNWAAEDGKVLWRQRMVMPVEGGYGALKAWMAQLLKEPALSIDSLDLQRPEASSDQVKARVALSLWWRRPIEPVKGGRP